MFHEVFKKTEQRKSEIKAFSKHIAGEGTSYSWDKAKIEIALKDSEAI